jgi:hypothetical protein
MIWMAPLGVVMFVALVAALMLSLPATPTAPAASRTQLTAYANAVAAVAAPAGQVVDTDMKPSVGSFEQGTLDGATLGARARAWSLTFHRTRAAIAMVSVPPGLDAAQSGFLAALDAYAHAADLFAAAAANQSQGATDLATAAARAADARYSAASAILQRALRAAGSPPDVRFPDQTP